MEYQLQPAQKFQALIPSGEVPDHDELRGRVRKCAGDFKMSWRNLAQALKVVWKTKSYKQWGYENFDDYTHDEVHIRKNTAMKLINSYSFLEQEAPQYCLKKEEPSLLTAPQDSEDIPSFEAVAALRRAKTKLDDADYQTMKRDVFENNKDAKEVKKDLTSLIRSREPVDPEKAQALTRERILKRFTFTLKTLRRDIKNLTLLPDAIVTDIDLLLEKIEQESGIDVKVE